MRRKPNYVQDTIFDFVTCLMKLLLSLMPGLVLVCSSAGISNEEKLMQAAGSGDVQTIERLTTPRWFARTVNVNCGALEHAVRRNQPEAVRALLRCPGIDVGKKSNYPYRHLPERYYLLSPCEHAIAANTISCLAVLLNDPRVTIDRSRCVDLTMDMVKWHQSPEILVRLLENSQCTAHDRQQLFCRCFVRAPVSVLKCLMDKFDDIIRPENQFLQEEIMRVDMSGPRMDLIEHLLADGRITINLYLLERLLKLEELLKSVKYYERPYLKERLTLARKLVLHPRAIVQPDDLVRAVRALTVLLSGYYSILYQKEVSLLTEIIHLLYDHPSTTSHAQALVLAATSQHLRSLLVYFLEQPNRVHNQEALNQACTQAVSATVPTHVKLLLDAKVHPDTLTDTGSTLLTLACARQDASSTRVLLEAGANPNIPDRHGYTPLIMASGGYIKESKSKRSSDDLGALSIVQILLDAQVPINHVSTIEGNLKTPLTIAAEQGLLATVAHLLHHPEMDINRDIGVGRQIKIARVLAQSNGHTPVVQQLITAGALIAQEPLPSAPEESLVMQYDCVH